MYFTYAFVHRYEAPLFKNDYRINLLHDIKKKIPSNELYEIKFSG